MNLAFTAPLVLLLFGLILASMRGGWLLGRRRLRTVGADAEQGLGAVEAAIFALMGLLIAFTFTGAASRFDHRRDLIVQEVNAIGTAWLRLDVLDEVSRRELRDLFRQYLDQRLAVYKDASDTAATAAALARVAQTQQVLWSRLQLAVRQDSHLPLAMLVLPPVNEMFDIAETRIRATQQHPPAAIYVLLGIFVLVSAMLAGFGMAKSQKQSKLHLIGFAATTAVAVYLILDLEYPRLGLIRVDYFDQALIDLRSSMQ